MRKEHQLFLCIDRDGARQCVLSPQNVTYSVGVCQQKILCPSKNLNLGLSTRLHWFFCPNLDGMYDIILGGKENQPQKISYICRWDWSLSILTWRRKISSLFDQFPSLEATIIFVSSALSLSYIPSQMFKLKTHSWFMLLVCKWSQVFLP